MQLESGLGLGPWDVLNQGISDRTPLSFGAANIAVSLVVLVIAWALGARIGVGTVANAVLIGVFVQLLLEIEAIERLSEQPVWARVGLLVAAILVVGLGSGLYIGAAFGAGPRDSLMLVGARRTGRPDRRRAGGPGSGRRVDRLRARWDGRRGDRRVRLRHRPGRGAGVRRAHPRGGRGTGELASRVRSRVMKGLVCAGGEATRLGELTRVTNKHLLPVGRWPMIFYPLQLLERAGVESVLVVTGKGHAGQMIDILGDGRLAARGTEDPLITLDVTYKVQTQPGGIAQVVGMARDFAHDDRLVVVLGDNVFERSQAAAIGAWAAGGDRALIFVKEVPDPENFGVVVYDEAGTVTDIVEKAGVVDMRYDAPPTNHAVVGLYCFPPDVFDVIDRLEPSSRGELEITDVNRHYAKEGRLDVVQVEGWWEDAGKHWQHLAEIGRLVEQTGANG